MHQHLLALALIASAGVSQAQVVEELVPPTPPETSVLHWVQGPPDPNPLEPDHYRNSLEQPLQTRLDDCWFFEAQAWERPMGDWRRDVAWLCSDIARKNSSDRPLRDSDKAMEQLLLAYEGQARAQMAEILVDWDTHVSLIEQAKPDADPMLPKAAVLRSGWLNSPSWHDGIAQSIGLDAVLESMQ